MAATLRGATRPGLAAHRALDGAARDGPIEAARS